jgi:O-antigen/teichoic acid export membrane protein
VFGRIKELFTSLVIYGAGEVAIQVVSLVLLPVFTRYLTPADYGILALLLSVETITKIVYRWGIDASFMRLYYDCETDAARQRLASTIFWFLALVNGALLSAALILVPTLAARLLGTGGYALAFGLVLVNTFVGGFFFIPFHVMRIEGRPRRFATLTFARSAATLVARLVLVVGLGMSVLGLWVADVVVTTLFCTALWPWFAPLIRPVFSRDLLRQALAFGLPRVPHALAQQAIAVSDRYLLTHFVSLRDIGIYSLGASFGLGLKLFMSAFEYAWAPFYFGAMNEPDAKETFSRVTTYAIGVLVLLACGLTAVAYDVVRLLTAPSYIEAYRIIPWIAFGVVLQGVYLLTSIGLNITKRTQYYMIGTFAAAATSVAANLLLIPRLGIVGSACANTLSYGVLAVTAMSFSQRFYPIRYEGRRLASIVVAGGAGLLIASVLPHSLPALVGLIARGAVVLVAYPAVLYVTGFFQPDELARVRTIAAQIARRRQPPAPEEHTVEMAGEIVDATLADSEDMVAKAGELGVKTGSR